MMRTQNDRKSLNASDDSVLALSDEWPICLRIHLVDVSIAKQLCKFNPMQHHAIMTCCFDFACGFWHHDQLLICGLSWCDP